VPDLDILPRPLGLVKSLGPVSEKWSGDTHSYLVARWGQALKDFDAICKVVRENWKEKRVAALKAAKAKVATFLLTVEDNAFNKFSGKGWIQTSDYF
jgi:hypothetical protein